MMPTEFVHIALLAFGGEIQGKTALQKKIYFLGVLTDVLDDLGYRPHFYGPYSDDVARAVEELKTIGYVDQIIRSTSLADAAGFERCRYDFRLTVAGSRVAQAKAKANDALWTKIKRIADKLMSADNLNYMKLSIAAKAHFHLGQPGARSTKEELAQLASKWGWRVTSEEIHDAAGYLEKLELLPQPAGAAT